MEELSRMGTSDLQQQHPDKMGARDMEHGAPSPEENDTHRGNAPDQKCGRNSGRALGEVEPKEALETE